MKRIFALTLALVMLLTLGACGRQETTPEPTPEPTPAPTAEPTPEPTPTATPEPEWEPGYIRVDNYFLRMTTLQRGDKVTVLGQWEDYYILEGEEANLLVEKRFVRPESEEAPAETLGWAQKNTLVYASANLQGVPVAELPLNTEVRVVDAKAGWAYIEWDGGSGYVDPAMISNQIIGGHTGGGGGGHTGGGGGGNTGGGGGGNTGGGGGGSPMDGTDVNMGDLSVTVDGKPPVTLLGTYVGPEYEAFDTCPGVILSAETEAYLCIFLRGDEVRVTEVTDGECEIWIKDLFVKIPRWTVRLESDGEYEAWTAYAANLAAAYTEYQMLHIYKNFSLNEMVHVVDKLEELGFYVVEIDGTFYYVKLDGLSETAYPVYSGGGGYTGGGGGNTGGGGGNTGGGGGNTGGGGGNTGGGGGGGDTPEWTPGSGGLPGKL